MVNLLAKKKRLVVTKSKKTESEWESDGKADIQSVSVSPIRSERQTSKNRLNDETNNDFDRADTKKDDSSRKEYGPKRLNKFLDNFQNKLEEK